MPPLGLIGLIANAPAVLWRIGGVLLLVAGLALGATAWHKSRVRTAVREAVAPINAAIAAQNAKAKEQFRQAEVRVSAAGDQLARETEEQRRKDDETAQQILAADGRNAVLLGNIKRLRDELAANRRSRGAAETDLAAATAAISAIATERDALRACDGLLRAGQGFAGDVAEVVGHGAELFRQAAGDAATAAAIARSAQADAARVRAAVVASGCADTKESVTP